ncbi:TonB-dependent receptor plug domain-containing protein [Desulfogranum japonicum]|uniref:TonB-dependent receptor plug domain-containing protein n=1 Tax=Desulfogranum japonicum TaxID=231447 RepID=UPI0004009C64|nr:TonB-dependent receptor plug domain-containing protein [Desulfogranum japonicum]
MNTCSRVLHHTIRLVSKSLAIFFSVLLFFSATTKKTFAAHEHSQHDVPATTEEMVVVADKLDDFVRKNPSQVECMGAAEIESRNFLQVQEVLGAMPGVDITSDSGGLGTRISIRGGGGSGAVLVLIDGRPASTMQYGGVDLSSIPIDIVEKITVFKPPVPVWLGPDSAAGAIYIETRKKKHDTYEKKGKIRATGGSYGFGTLSATGQLDTESSQYLVSGGASHKDGTRDNSQKDQGHLNLGYTYKEDGRELQVNGKAYISDHGIAGPTYNPTPDAEQRYEKASLDLQYKGFTDDADYTLKGWTDAKRLDETSQSGEKSKLDTATAGLGSDFYFSVDDDDNELRIGGQFEQSWVDHTLSGEHDRSSVSTHSEYNIRQEFSVYTLGGRVDYTNDFDFSPGGHLGMSHEFSETTQVKANIGYSEHVPTFSQLYQPSHGAIDQVRGNPDLDKEKIFSMSLGVEQDIFDRHTLSVSLFRTDSMDLIKYQRDDNNISSPLNIDQAYKQGVEATLKFVLSDKHNDIIIYKKH